MLDFPEFTQYLDRLDAVFSDLDGTLLHNEGTALDRIGEEIDRYICASNNPNLKPEYKHNGIGNIRYLAGTPPDSIIQIAEQRSFKN